MPGLFITGTDTDVGKTHVAAEIARQLTGQGLSVGVYKPVASGCRWVDGELISDDAVALWEAAGRPRTLRDVCPQCFEAALAPPLAARAAGAAVNPGLLRAGLAVWDGCDFLIVEGVGGLMSPISDEEFVRDLAYDFQLPMLVVAANRIGVVNQTLQTLITASTFREGLELTGVVLNDVTPRNDDCSRDSNYKQLQRHCGPPVIARVPPVLAHVAFGGTIEGVDWLAAVRE